MSKFRLTLKEALVLADLAHDLGKGVAILRYDTRLYDKWARPTKEYRSILLGVSAKLATEDVFDCDYFSRFETVERPNFPKR